MLKHFSKTIMIAIISSVLTTTPVLAQTTTSPTSTATTTTTTAPPVGQEVVQTDASGKKSAVSTQKFDKVEDSDMIASITMLAIGAIGTRMAIGYKPITTDVMIAAAGAAAFIAGEIMSTMKFKKTIEETQMQIVKQQGTPNQEQIEALQKLKESYEEAKKAIKTKSTLQKAAAVAFGAAAAWATYMAFTEVSHDATCKAGILAAKAPLATCTGVPYTAAECGACTGIINAYEIQYNVYSAKRYTPAPSVIKAAEDAATKTTLAAGGKCPGTVAMGISAAVNAKCAAAIAANTANETKGPVLTVTESILFPKAQYYSYEDFQSKEIKSDESPIDFFLDLFIPRTHAGMMSILGLGAGAAASFFLISGPLAAKLDIMMYVPKNRAIVFAALAGLSFMASKSSDGVIAKLEANIKKIDAILAELNSLGKGIATQNSRPQTIQLQAFDPNAKQVASFSPDNTTKFPCATSTASTSCPSMEEQLKNIPGYAQMPPALQAMATQSSKMSDGISGSTGISGATMSAASSLAGKQNAVNNLLKKTQKALNDKLKKAGKPGINFDKEQSNFLGGMAASVKKSLQKGGTTPSQFMSSIGSLPINSKDLNKPDAGEEITAGNVGSEGAVAPGIGGEKMDLSFSEEPTEAVAEAAPGTQPEYEMNQDEIHKDTGPSIFELISSRYLKSGYPKLLEEEPTKK